MCIYINQKPAGTRTNWVPQQVQILVNAMTKLCFHWIGVMTNEYLSALVDNGESISKYNVLFYGACWKWSGQRSDVRSEKVRWPRSPEEQRLRSDESKQATKPHLRFCLLFTFLHFVSYLHLMLWGPPLSISFKYKWSGGDSTLVGLNLCFIDILIIKWY